MAITDLASVLLMVATNVFASTCTSAPQPIPSASPQNGSASATGPSQNAGDTVPALQILSPKDGETITLPSAVRYAIKGVTLAADGAHIEAFLQGVADSPMVVLELSDEVGLAYLPSNKLLTGRRDLTFVLTRADGTRFDNGESRVTVYKLTIQGGR